MAETAANFAHLAPGARLGQRRHWDHLHRRGLIGATGDKFQRFGAVDCGGCIGPGDHRGNAACGSSQAG
jgi:hypothetical protein